MRRCGKEEGRHTPQAGKDDRDWAATAPTKAAIATKDFILTVEWGYALLAGGLSTWEDLNEWTTKGSDALDDKSVGW
jgi:hypothetical protein